MSENHSLLFSLVSESELNEILAGSFEPNGVNLHGGYRPRIRSSELGVIFRKTRSETTMLTPMAIVAPAEAHRRLFGRMSQVRSDFSPLSVWCHVVSPERFEALDDLERTADLSGLESAWTGLVIAESLLLAERSISEIKIAACLSTQSFAVARAVALWGKASLPTILARYDDAHQLMRAGSGASRRLRSILEEMWKILSEIPFEYTGVSANSEEPVISALRSLFRARVFAKHIDEAAQFAEPLMHLIPEEAAYLFDVSSRTPEERVRYFDRLISSIEHGQREQSRRLALSVLAGYVATIAAGGSASLSLAEKVSRRYPEVLAWAYVIGSLGEKVSWTSAFDGLGRLVARELTRSFSLGEAPYCDFSLEEAVVLIDQKIADPFVHLRLKQSRILTVALLPGVNCTLPVPAISEANSRTRRVVSKTATERESAMLDTGSSLNALADALLPLIIRKVLEVDKSSESSETSYLSKLKRLGRKKEPAQRKLPLKGD